MSKIWVDPPAGWVYGFPKVYDSEKDGNMYQWLIREGYPLQEKLRYIGRLFYVNQWEYIEGEVEE